MSSLQQLRRRLASSEDRRAIEQIRREAERIGSPKATALAERAADKRARCTSKSARKPPAALGGSCPQIKQIIEEWSYDELGNMSRVSYSVDA